jgi:hypothetical protein
MEGRRKEVITACFCYYPSICLKGRRWIMKCLSQRTVVIIFQFCSICGNPSEVDLVTFVIRTHSIHYISLLPPETRHTRRSCLSVLYLRNYATAKKHPKCNSDTGSEITQFQVTTTTECVNTVHEREFCSRSQTSEEQSVNVYHVYSVRTENLWKGVCEVQYTKGIKDLK